jgi:hypothetical protein
MTKPSTMSMQSNSARAVATSDRYHPVGEVAALLSLAVQVPSATQNAIDRTRGGYHSFSTLRLRSQNTILWDYF